MMRTYYPLDIGHEKMRGWSATVSVDARSWGVGFYVSGVQRQIRFATMLGPVCVNVHRWRRDG